MFRILYSGIVKDVLKALADALGGHVTLSEWHDILSILKSHRLGVPRLAFCPSICRPFAWAAFLASQVYTPRRRRFDSLMLYFKARQPGPFNSTTLAAHLSIRWPGEARHLLEVLSQTKFLLRVKKKGQVSYYLSRLPGPPLSLPGPPSAASTRLVAGQRS
jgi:hypothetical protein